MNLKRVVVTGLGALTPLGKTVADYWHGLADGASLKQGLPVRLRILIPLFTSTKRKPGKLTALPSLPLLLLTKPLKMQALTKTMLMWTG
jgi:hypothetical protein